MPDGEVIARNYTSFVPVSNNVRFACSKDSGEWKYKLPAAWTNQKAIRNDYDLLAQRLCFAVRQRPDVDDDEPLGGVADERVSVDRGDRLLLVTREAEHA